MTTQPRPYAAAPHELQKRAVTVSGAPHRAQCGVSGNRTAPMPTAPAQNMPRGGASLETTWKREVADSGKPRLASRRRNRLDYGQSATKRRPKATRARALCKPEVTGSIPVRSIEKGPGNRAICMVLEGDGMADDQTGRHRAGSSTRLRTTILNAGSPVTQAANQPVNPSAKSTGTKASSLRSRVGSHQIAARGTAAPRP